MLTEVNAVKVPDTTARSIDAAATVRIVQNGKLRLYERLGQWGGKKFHLVLKGICALGTRSTPVEPDKKANEKQIDCSAKRGRVRIY